MVIQFPSWPLALSCFLPVSLMILFILNKFKDSERLPPGPTKLPIIGNLHNLFFAGDDHFPRVLRDLANKHGPFMHLKMGKISQIVVSSSDLAEEFLKMHDINFASRQDIFTSRILTYNNSDVAFAPYGEYWRQVRKIITLDLLSVKKVKSFNRLRRDEVCKMIDIFTKSAIAGTPINLSQIFLTLNINIVARSVFGTNFKYQKTFLIAMKEFIDFIIGLHICNYFPALENFAVWLTGLKKRTEKTHRTIDHILDKIIHEHLQKSNDNDVVVDGEGDLLDTLLKIQKKSEFNFEFTKSNLKAIIMDMITGGTETISTTLEWVMSELIKNPEPMKKVTAEVRKVFRILGTKIDDNDNSFTNEMGYMQNVIKETFRLHPPSPLLIPHECREKCQTNGYNIEEKTNIIVNVWTIGRDPNKWKDSEVFKPERFVGNPIDFKRSHFDLIPFGSGRRICPGITFGMANVELSLASILYHFNWKMPNDAPGKELDMTESYRGTMGRKHPLILVPVIPTST